VAAPVSNPFFFHATLIFREYVTKPPRVAVIRLLGFSLISLRSLHFPAGRTWSPFDGSPTDGVDGEVPPPADAARGPPFPLLYEATLCSPLTPTPPHPPPGPLTFVFSPCGISSLWGVFSFLYGPLRRTKLVFAACSKFFFRSSHWRPPG